ncbi:hypothetical protein Gotur_029674 [Gossypium turneri]
MGTSDCESRTEGETMELQHFSHPHPLVFIKYQTVASKEVDPEAAFCIGCDKHVEGWSYGCNQCEFNLHKGCAELELAPKIQHPLHPKHPLTLLPNSDRYPRICDLCDCTYPTVFNLHKECSELSLEINHPYDRKHPLTLLPQPPTHLQKCSCSLCIIQWKGFVYSCSLCNFDLSVSDFPFSAPKITVASHEHPICYEEVDIRYGNYRCPASRCRYIAHVRCATDNAIWGGTILPEGYDERSEEVVDEPWNLITDVVKKIRIGELMVASEIKHSYHDHNLRLTFSGETKDDDRLYSWDVAYRCMRRCDFSLDVGCATLPLTAWYKYDRHALTLTFSDDSEPSQLYCDLCEEEREPKDWFYYCADCDNSLHLNCAIGDLPYMKLGNRIKVMGHRHLLTVVKNIWNCPPCKVCGEVCNGQALECKESECNFTVHWDCRWGGR